MTQVILAQGVRALAPEGTAWFGGAVDSSKMSLRVHCPQADRATVSALLGHGGCPTGKLWSLSAPVSNGADIDGQIAWIFSQVTADLGKWRQLRSQHRIDLFCGLFLERSNRGVSLAPETMEAVAKRGISLGFDIYGPE